MLLEYERQSSSFADGQQVLEENLDSMFELDDEQTSTDQAVAGVFQELGLELEMVMSKAGRDVSMHPPSVEDLESRLQNLKVRH